MPKDPGIHLLNDVDIQSYRMKLVESGFDSGCVEYGLAEWVILQTFGADFWKKECALTGDKQEFFKSKTLTRNVHLAHLIWRIKSCKGFEEFVTKNNPLDFESTYYELCAIDNVLQSSELVDIIIPTGVRGRDFDLKAYSFRSNETFNFEVKARRKQFTNSGTLKNFLSEHRTQLPKDEPGGYICKLELGSESISEEELISTTCNFLKGTNRIELVIFLWEAIDDDRAIGQLHFGVTKYAEKIQVFAYKGNPMIYSYMQYS